MLDVFVAIYFFDYELKVYLFKKSLSNCYVLKLVLLHNQFLQLLSR